MCKKQRCKDHKVRTRQKDVYASFTKYIVSHLNERGSVERQMTSSRVRDGKGRSDPEAVTMADDVDIIVENAQLHFLSDSRQEADGVERKLELRTRPHERTSDRLHVFATHHELNGDDAGRTIVRLTQNKNNNSVLNRFDHRRLSSLTVPRRK